MIIGHNNFEEYILDYLEGNLDPVLTAELMAFIAENPTYEGYICGLQSLKSDHDVSFPAKNMLKKDYDDIPSINPDNFDEFCIASSEGLLGPKQIERLNNYIGEDTLKIKNLELFSSLKLRPDSDIKFPLKEKIRKQKAGVLQKKIFYYGIAIAASVIFVFMLTINRTAINNSESKNVTASNNSPAPEITKNFPGNTGSSIISEVQPSRVHKKNTYDNKVKETPADVSSGRQEEVFLTAMKPVTRNIQSAVTTGELYIPEIKHIQVTAKEVKPERQIRISQDNLFAELFSRINLWKTAETAVDGFNYLTEARLSINKTTDDQGKLKGLSLNTESYIISGKVR